ncbi:hypothetical protein H4Q26_003738 [Puccinia striiformis f. sp. tritici PST-130]|nr:hypothetical protein H4Q26_003738 [Puccinia striiformis f. sp. tritici PST-130]
MLEGSWSNLTECNLFSESSPEFFEEFLKSSPRLLRELSDEFSDEFSASSPENPSLGFPRWATRPSIGFCTRFNCRHNEYLAIPHPSYLLSYFATGMHPPPRELASLGQTSSIENRDGILDISSPPGWSSFYQSIESPSTFPPAKTYRHMIEWSTNIIPHTSSSPLQRAMNTYPAGRDSRDDPIPPGVVITRNRDSDDGCFCLNRYFIGGLVGVGATIIVLTLIFYLGNV